MMKYTFKRYVLFGLILAVTCTCLCEYYEILTLIEDQTLSLRQLMRTTSQTAAKFQKRKVVLISMDDNFYNKVNVKPYRRSHLSDIIKNIHKLGAKLIVINLLMQYPQNPYEDNSLFEILDDPAYNNVILASHVDFDYGAEIGKHVLPSATIKPEPISTGYINIISPCAVVTYISRLRLYPDLVENLNAWPLPVKAAAKYLDTSPRISNDNNLILGDKKFKIDQNNDLYIDYSPAPPEAIHIKDYIGLSAYAVYDVNFPDDYTNAHQYFESFPDGETSNLIGLLYWIKDKIIVIGDTSTDTRDWFDTPVGTMYGSEIVADSINTLISDTSLRPAAFVIEAFISIIMHLLIFLSVMRFKNVHYGFGVYILINVIFTIGCAILYVYYGYIITMSYNYLFGLIVYLSATLYYRSIDAYKREQSRIKLEIAEAKYRGIFENAIEGIFQLDEKDHIISANPALCEILGYNSYDELQRLLVDRDTRLYVNKEDQQALLQSLKKNDVVKGFTIQVMKKDGSHIWIALNIRRITNQCKVMYEGFVTDITAIKERSDNEREAQAEKAAIQSRSEVLASLSHELRTPLNAILGMAERLKKSNLTNEQQESVAVFEMAGEHLLVLINDVLDLTKLEAGSIELDIKPFDFNILIQMTREFANMNPKRNAHVDIVYNIQKNMPTDLCADKDRLQQIISNLMNNAIKFTQKGSITLTVTTHPLQEFDSITLPEIDDDDTQLFFFQVKDTGTGIPESQQKNIFDTFCQIKPDAKNDGAGLGLAICKRLVHIMNGNIVMNSQVNTGSTFSFVVPLKCYSGGINETSKELSLDPLNLLLVEDNLNNQMVFSVYLGEIEHQIDTAFDGIEGVEKFKNNTYDIVFMDLQMPNMNGIEATEAIRQWEKEKNLPPTPIIAVSAQTFLQKNNEAIKAGCDDYIPKPLDKSILLKKLFQYCGKH